MKKHEARAFINSLITLRKAATDEQAVDAPAVYPEWKEDVQYYINDRVLYNGTLYKVLADHTSQETWTPTDAPSLFTKVLIPDDEKIYPWEQPDSTNAYKKDDKVTHNDKTWISIIDNNVWEPGVYGWEVIV